MNACRRLAEPNAYWRSVDLRTANKVERLNLDNDRLQVNVTKSKASIASRRLARLAAGLLQKSTWSSAAAVYPIHQSQRLHSHIRDRPNRWPRACEFGLSLRFLPETQITFFRRLQAPNGGSLGVELDTISSGVSTVAGLHWAFRQHLIQLGMRATTEICRAGGSWAYLVAFIGEENMLYAAAECSSIVSPDDHREPGRARPRIPALTDNPQEVY
jgi:hypothetical protein